MSRSAVAWLAALAFSLLAWAPSASAGTRTCTSTSPHAPGGLETLIATSAPGDTIVFGTPFTSGSRQFIFLPGDSIEIDHDLTIIGPGTDRLWIWTPVSAVPADPRGAIVTSAHAAISELTFVENGGTTQTAFANTGTLDLTHVGFWGFGVAIVNAGTLHATRVRAWECYGDSGAVLRNLGSATLTGCSLMDNFAGGRGDVFCGNGSVTTIEGCVFARGSGDCSGLACDPGSSVTLTSTTFYGETPNASVIANDGGTLALRGCTVTACRAAQFPETFLGLALTAGSTTLQNTIVAGNDPVLGVVGSIYGDAWTDLGHNLIQTGVSLDPKLLPLGGYGGLTECAPPAAGSPAVDAGASDGVTSDQRDLGRPFDMPAVVNATDGDAADIGAVELGPTIQVTSPTKDSAWQAGWPDEVQWTTQLATPSMVVDLWLSRDAGRTWAVFALGRPNTGSYVKQGGVPGPATSGLVRAELREIAMAFARDTSDLFQITYSVAVGDEPGAEFALAPVAPNPSGGELHTALTLLRAARARVTLMDVQGREVVVLLDADLGAGRHPIGWSRTRLPAGVYLLRAQADGRALVRRIAIVR